jgi:hypothetical protein
MRRAAEAPTASTPRTAAAINAWAAALAAAAKLCTDDGRRAGAKRTKLAARHAPSPMTGAPQTERNCRRDSMLRRVIEAVR